MSDRAGVLYADASALVKLAVREAESDALREELEQWQDVATSVITGIELARAVSRARATGAQTIDELEVASALSLDGDLAAVLTYDKQMQQAASARGLSVLAPS